MEIVGLLLILVWIIGSIFVVVLTVAWIVLPFLLVNRLNDIRQHTFEINSILTRKFDPS